VTPAAVAASLSFDALLQFQPFGLIVDLTINATVLLGGSPVLSLSLDLHVTGPTPWAVTGSASFQVLCCSFTVPISITAGPQPPPQPPQTVDLDDNLTTALADSRSWQTGPPAGHGVVTVRGQNAASSAVHPLGTLTVRQHAVPLELHIERYGPDLLDAACSYQITAATIGGLAAQAADVTDFFAPAQFQTMTDAQKASPAGVQLGQLRQTLFMGDTLRGLLLYGYAFATIGTIVGIAAWFSFGAAAILLVLFALGLWHARRVEVTTKKPTVVATPAHAV